MVLEWIASHWELLLVCALVLLTLVLFLTERFPFEITALLVLVVLAASGILTVEEAYSGFANTAMLTVLMMFVLSETVVQVGLIDWLGDKVAPWFGTGGTRQVFIVILLVAPVSAFINNAAAVAVLIPLIMRLCAQAGRSPSKLLIPLSYAGMLGGTITVIGTSTNLLASDLAAREGLGKLGMFTFAPVGLGVLAVGALYLILVGHRLVPARVKPQGMDERFHLREFLFEVRVPEESPLVGQVAGEGALAKDYEAEILQIYRSDRRIEPDEAKAAYAVGDHVLLRAPRAKLEAIVEAGIVELVPVKGAPASGEETHGFAELLVGYNSSARGKRLGQLDLPKRYGVRAVAVLGGDSRRDDRLYHRKLRGGDILLVHGRQQRLKDLTGGDEFMVLGGPPVKVRRPAKIPLVLAVLAGVVGLAAFEILPIVVTATAGVVLVVAAGALRLQDMYRAIHWEVILLLAGIIPLGVALEKTGGASAIAGLVAQAGPYLPPVVLLAAVYILTTFLTELVSNNASILLVGPIAIELARQLSLNPLTFLLAVMFAASTSMLTPIGYKTNLLVFAPGGYRFTDYARVGAPLNVLLAIVTPLLLAHFFPL
jgi:di/tricarboxylate transporter